MIGDENAVSGSLYLPLFAPHQAWKQKVRLSLEIVNLRQACSGLMDYPSAYCTYCLNDLSSASGYCTVLLMKMKERPSPAVQTASRPLR